MLFHTPIFLFCFLPIILLLYFVISKYSKKSFYFTLIAGGLIFYAWWNIYFTPLIIISIIFNYYFGNLMIKAENFSKKKIILFFSISCNVIYLGIFKYTDFIIYNINFLFNSNIQLLNLPFPLAMSFFTFQTIAYLVDCYDGKIFNNNLKKYALFIIFFPQLIAGPIVRYNNMMPQFENDQNRKINHNNIILGLIVISIGLFKKTLLANNLGIIADQGFLYSENLDFISGWLTSLSFTFQIYFDFGGYIDMATGIALMFNIKLPQNFDSPYKSTSIINFWQRWHITLSNFLMNYIYFPTLRLFDKINFFKTMLVAIFVFLIAGIWHGPTWFYVIFGLMHGIGLVINHIYRKFINIKLYSLLGWLLTFNYVNVSLIFFRSDNISQPINILKSMIGINGINLTTFQNNEVYLYFIFILACLISFVFKSTYYLLKKTSDKFIQHV